jgi:sporulation protein YlmC with PRC-barrel domain
VLVGSDSLVGSAVRDTDGRDIGKVNRLMIDPYDGRITSVIIATGGTLGMGSNTISVPWSSVKIGQDRGKLIVTASQTLEPTPTNRTGSATDPQRRQ